ncbi:MAG: hypothetical protein QOD69_2268 [Solirubrobacteraceae bacterium]|nr:hypothetical protein [Solirubrobacteraceae bacterium]
MVVLVARSGPLTGHRYALDERTVLGREDATITLPDEETSRRHAEIRVEGPVVLIEDLGSTNGTFVDGERIAAATPLRGGETIKLGTTVFAVEVEVAAAPEPGTDPGATRIARRPPAPEPIADPDRTALRPRPSAPPPPPDPVPEPDPTRLRPRPPAPEPEPVADPERTAQRPRPPRPEPVPAAAAPAAPAPRPPARPPAPRAPAATPADDPFGTFSPPAPRRRRGAASRKLGPTLASFATIIVTAVALVVYFAGR